MLNEKLNLLNLSRCDFETSISGIVKAADGKNGIVLSIFSAGVDFKSDSIQNLKRWLVILLHSWYFVTGKTKIINNQNE